MCRGYAITIVEVDPARQRLLTVSEAGVRVWRLSDLRLLKEAKYGEAITKVVLSGGKAIMGYAQSCLSLFLWNALPRI